jgi:hypothetical protein
MADLPGTKQPSCAYRCPLEGAFPAHEARQECPDDGRPRCCGLTTSFTDYLCHRNGVYDVNRFDLSALFGRSDRTRLSDFYCRTR